MASALPNKSPSSASEAGLPCAVKRIQLREQHLDTAQEISAQYKLSAVAGRVLAARGHQLDPRLQHYINPTLREGLPDPKSLKNLEAASSLLAEHVRARKKIAICCDFDVDGLSGGSQVVHFLRTLGAEVLPFVPDRFTEGYGLNAQMIRDIAAAGCAILVAIDFGTTNTEEVLLARSLGLQTIVIDHHSVGEHRSPADVFINPQQADCGFADGILCAAGLAWYLLIGLKTALKQEAAKLEVRAYLDLACLGTICDMVPLVGANRIIARRGLEVLSASQRPGLMALKNAMGCRQVVGCSEVSFGIGPRLNAAGRMVHGALVLDLLTTSDTDKAAKLARRLNALNADRQEMENHVRVRALQKVSALPCLPWGLVVWDESFHTGVVGIVAQRMVEAFYRPCVILGRDKEGIFKGSVRGIRGFNVVEALGAVKECLIKYGGHAGAGGLSLNEDRLPEFSEAFNLECQRRLKDLPLQPVSEADTEVTLAEIDVHLIEELKKFSPYGMGNPQPGLLSRGLSVCSVKDLKNTHLKAMLTDGRRYISGILWRQNSHPALRVGAKVDVVYRPELSTYGGISELYANLQAVQEQA